MRRPALFACAILTLLLPPRLLADATIWFEDARHSPALSDDSVRSLTAYVRHKLLTPPGSPPADAPLLPRELRDDFFPRVVFISACDGVRPARVAAGSARGVLKATDEALATLSPKAGETFQPRWLKIDIPSAIFLQENLDLTRRLEFERSLFGLAFPRGARVALLPEELIASNVINHEQGFFPDQLNAFLEERGAKPSEVLKEFDPEKATLFRFSTQAFFADRDEILPLYRGHRTFSSLTRSQLKQSATDAANYLAQSVLSSGQFAYLYHPDTNKTADEYTLLNHFVAVLAMAEAYKTSKNPELLDAIKRAVDFTDHSTASWTEGGKRVPVVIENSQVRLGTQAMAAAALAEVAKVSGDRSHRDRAYAYGVTVRSMEREGGDYVHYQSYPGGQVRDPEHPDFTGQAIVALMALSQDRDDQWHDLAERAANRLILVRDKGVPVGKLPHDHWLLRGLADLNRTKASPLFVEHASRLTQAMTQAQFRAPPYTDWLGGYYSPPGAMTAAHRTDALLAAYTVLRKQKDDHSADTVAALEAAILGATFQLQCQFRPETAMYFKDPSRIVGAFRESLTSPAVRIDFVAHNLLAILRLHRLMEELKIDSFAVPPAERAVPVEPAPATK